MTLATTALLALCLANLGVTNLGPSQVETSKDETSADETNAEGREAPALRTITLRGGQRLTGDVHVVGDQRVAIDLEPRGRAEFPIAVLSYQSARDVLSRNGDPDPSELHVQLADYCIANDMYRQAAEELKAAIAGASETDRDELEARLTSTQDQVVANSLARADRLVEIGEMERAGERYRAVAHDFKDHDEVAATVKQRLADLSDRLTEAPRDERREVLEQRNEKWGPDIEKARDLLGVAREYRERAIADLSDLGDAEDYLLDARSRATRAVAKLDRVLAAYGTTITSSQNVAPVKDTAHVHVVTLRDKAQLEEFDILITLGHHYIVSGDLLEAYRYVGLATQIDADAPEVAALRQAIAAASADRRGRFR